jgi:hypothetical protein
MEVFFVFVCLSNLQVRPGLPNSPRDNPSGIRISSEGNVHRSDSTCPWPLEPSLDLTLRAWKTPDMDNEGFGAIGNLERNLAGGQKQLVHIGCSRLYFLQTL